MASGLLSATVKNSKFEGYFLIELLKNLNVPDPFRALPQIFSSGSTRQNVSFTRNYADWVQDLQGQHIYISYVMLACISNERRWAWRSKVGIAGLGLEDEARQVAIGILLESRKPDYKETCLQARSIKAMHKTWSGVDIAERVRVWYWARKASKTDPGDKRDWYLSAELPTVLVPRDLVESVAECFDIAHRLAREHYSEARAHFGRLNIGPERSYDVELIVEEIWFWKYGRARINGT